MHRRDGGRGSARRRSSWRGILALGLAVMIAPLAGGHEDDATVGRFMVMVKRNLDQPFTLPSAAIDSLMTSWSTLPLGEKAAAWARYFLDRGDVSYLFGRAPGGYVAEGRICSDYATDCVLFMLRATELARSTTAEEAVQFAFGTRFYGASVEHAVADDGRVDYDDPAVLQFAEDQLGSGIWGRDVTAQCGGALVDTVGSVRVDPDTLRFLPRGAIDYGRLESGDVVWFVGDERRPGGEEERRAGTMIHHIGILDRQGSEVDLIHPASVPLAGIYERTGLVRVPLRTYLERVGRFKGIVVTRLTEF